MAVQELICTEVWGGNGNILTDLVIPGLKGVLFSRASDGHKGGDVYYATACSGGLISRLFLADVTGHGEQVVRFSQWLHDILRDTVDYHEPSRVFAAINERVHDFGLEAMTTAASFTFNSIDRELAVCYAGHPPALVSHPGETAWHPVEIPPLARDTTDAQNLPLGVSQSTRYVHESCPLKDGARIFVYSDGLTETPDPAGAFFGMERLHEVLTGGMTKPVAEAAQDVIDAVARHAGSQSFRHDDITFAMVEVTTRRSAPVVLQVVQNKLRHFFKRSN